MQSNDGPPDKPGVGAGNGYEVGYGKPPKYTRFRAGRSGNPAGRRRGARNLMTDVKHTLRVPVKVKENGRARKISTQEGAQHRQPPPSAVKQTVPIPTRAWILAHERRRRSCRAAAQ